MQKKWTHQGMLHLVVNSCVFICTGFSGSLRLSTSSIVALQNLGIELFNNGDGEIAGNAANDATLAFWLKLGRIKTGW